MKIEQVKIGDVYTYYPDSSPGENLHYKAKVEGIAKTVKIRIFTQDKPDGVLRNVSAKRLVIQKELL